MLRKVKWVSVGAATVSGMLGVASASAAPLFTQAALGNRSASAVFEVKDDTKLQVTLTNTSLVDVEEPEFVLTAVFFDIPGNPTLGRESAVVAVGSTVLFGTTDPGNVVGGEWAYKGGLVGAPHGAAYGISSAGFNLVGPMDRFPGSDLQNPDSPDGLQYGITSAGDNPATGNTPVTGANALIKNSVVFVLTGLPQSFDPLTAISNVSFQYGTGLDEPNLIVPEPAAAALLLGGLMFAVRRRG